MTRDKTLYECEKSQSLQERKAYKYARTVEVFVDLAFDEDVDVCCSY